MRQIILASLSPRRKDLLEKAGLKFLVKDSGFNERIGRKLSPRKLAERLSYGKASALSESCKNSVIIGADTIVVLGGKVLGKPKSPKSAKSMLKMLRGKEHRVITAFTVMDTLTKKSVTRSVQTKVFMRNFGDDEIECYVSTGEPLDKAGSYGIQGKGGMLVSRIDGDYDNVVGLPVKDVMAELRKLGI